MEIILLSVAEVFLNHKEDGWISIQYKSLLKH
jgi:hypothetical protein